MTVLAAADRAALRDQFMRDLSALREALGVTKADIAAAVNATDDWIEANKAAYNAALPLPFRTAATAAQKNRLFSVVADLRFGRGS